MERKKGDRFVARVQHNVDVILLLVGKRKTAGSIVHFGGNEMAVKRRSLFHRVEIVSKVPTVHLNVV